MTAERLPLLASVPHAGTSVPPEAAPYCMLTPGQIIVDGDEGASEIYAPLLARVTRFVTTDVARAVVDMNRAEDDRRKDGILKTHTHWDVPVWDPPLPEDVAEALIERYHRPYHARLDELATAGDLLGVDCHTMAAIGPPIGPDPGEKRPLVCLGNDDGTCPDAWMQSLAECFEAAFGAAPSINRPFRGGHIIRAHSEVLPWVQIEISRTPKLSSAAKGAKALSALEAWCARGFHRLAARRRS